MLKTKPKIRTYTPCWTGPIEGYSINVVRRAWPQLSASYEFEDLLQEAYIKFLMCSRRYRGKVTNAAWFMSLYKCALCNHLASLASRNARYSFTEFKDITHNTCSEPDFLECSCETIEVLLNLPAEMQTVLSNLIAGVKAKPQQAQELKKYLIQELGVQ